MRRLLRHADGLWPNLAAIGYALGAYFVGWLGLLAHDWTVNALASLLLTIIDDSFGIVAVVNENEPEAILASYGYDPTVTVLSDLNKDQLVEVLAEGCGS